MIGAALAVGRAWRWLIGTRLGRGLLAALALALALWRAARWGARREAGRRNREDLETHVEDLETRRAVEDGLSRAGDDELRRRMRRW